MKTLTFFLLIFYAQITAYAEGLLLQSAVEKTTAPLQKINELMQLGVPGLALRKIEQQQVELSLQNIEAWAAFEYKRIAILQHLKKWSQIIARIEQQTKNMQAQSILFADIDWYKTQLIKARIKNDQPQQALLDLRSLLWNLNEYTDADDIAIWRQLVIRVYMNMDKLQDAQRAMRRYKQDYGDVVAGDINEWRRLQAQLLLRTDRADEAVQLLEKLTAPKDRSLLLLAQMQAKLLSDWAVENKVQKLLDNDHLSDHERLVYQYTLLIALASQKKLLAQISVLEGLLTQRAINQLQYFYYPAQHLLTPDYLWSLYERLGMKLANEKNLLQGDDAAWFLLASNWVNKKPQYAKALFAVLLFKSASAVHRMQSSQQLMQLLEKQNQGLSLIHALFMDSQRISDLLSIPSNVRYRLIDFALSRGDIKTAAVLMAGLQRPPDGENIYAWNLRRARVFILGGDYQQGADLLLQILSQQTELKDDKVDPLMQVIFDLQSIQQHTLALQLFNRLLDFELSEKLQREIPFWQAESYQALNNYEQAAYLYLQSARPLAGKYDPWFHTASFRAAESLAKAGLLADARRQYLRLLKITRNSARKAVISQRLQQLQLKANS